MQKENFELIQDSHVLSLRLKAEYDHSLKVPFDLPNDFEFKETLAVFMHIFYTDLIAEIMSYIKNIPAPADLYISTDTEEKKERIEKLLQNYSNGKIVIRIFANRGRDIAPCFVGFRDIFDKYEYLLHIHTKKSIYNPNLAKWRKYILDTLIGSPEIAISNLYLLSQDDIGILYPQHFPDIQKNIEWGNNFQNTKWLLGLSGIEISHETLLEFPSSSMFFAKTAALKKLYTLPVLWDDFEKERGQIDGTLAHAYERSFLYFCESSGYKWVKVDKGTHTRHFELNNLDPFYISEQLEHVYPKVLGNYHVVFARLQAEWMVTNNTLSKKLRRVVSALKRKIRNILI
jgi:lipopolysaccharide biosynthesis protein